MVHAGVLPAWDASKTIALASELRLCCAAPICPASCGACTATNPPPGTMALNTTRAQCRHGQRPHAVRTDERFGHVQAGRLGRTFVSIVANDSQKLLLPSNR